MASIVPRINKIEKTMYGSAINTAQIAAPNTEIVGQDGVARQIPDITDNLKVSGGVERIMFNSINSLDKEFGPNGETVYELDTKDARIRFVGEGWQTLSTTSGTYVTNTDKETTDFIEITFFGTGLNMLNLQNASTGNYRVTEDGGAEAANAYVVESPLIHARNYSSNTVHNISSGLAEGIHTIKIRQGDAGVTNAIMAYGIEILNEQTEFTINPGKPLIGDLTREVLSAQNLPFKPAAFTGTRGGRVLIVQSEDGTISQKFTEVDATQFNFGGANHANEEIIERRSYVSFGANRSDDFSVDGFGTSDRAFTLNDGTTTLAGASVAVSATSSGDYLSGAAGSFWTLTFVGTGFGLYGDTSSANIANGEFFIDGVSIGEFGNSLDIAEFPQVHKIVSGLPYGTHTIKMYRNTEITRSLEFITYGPKKPDLEIGDVILADYNVMADYIANSTQGLETIAQGVLRKSCQRETVYSGTWVFSALNPNLYVGGLSASSTTSGGYVEYSFWGTGFELRGYDWGSGSTNVSVLINGSLATTGNFAGLVSSIYGYDGFSAGILDTSGSNLKGAGLSISGLPLARYTVRFLNNVAVAFQHEAFDIITPIHINDFQSGSNSIRDEREEVKVQEELSKQVDLSKAKAWIKYDHINNVVLASHNVSAVIDVSTGHADVHFEKPFKDDNYIINGAAMGVSLFLAGNHAIAQGMTKSSYRVIVQQSNTTGYIDTVWTAAFYGELENEDEL